MILGAERLRRLFEHPAEDPADRLVISPILDIDNQLKPGSASIDIRLGQRFQVPRRTKLSALDHLAPDHETNVEKYKDSTFVRIGDYFVLHPRQFVLGETLEWVHLPATMAAYVVGRSSWGRDGLVIATATGVHPGFSGILTLEISNMGEIPIYLYPGVTIAQLFIMEVEGTSEASSIHMAQTEPESANAALDDKEIIKYFGQKQ